MTILVSTTWRGPERTELAEVLAQMEGLDIDGIELGSTHLWRDDLLAIAQQRPLGRILVHNYFPPAKVDLVINLASLDDDIRQHSVEHAKKCLRFSADLGAETYTVHPGFVVEPAMSPNTAPHVRRNFDFTYGNDRAPQEEAFQLMLASLEQLVAEAAHLGVGLAVETQGSASNPVVSLMEKFEDYERLFDHFPEGLGLNFNLAHTVFAGKYHGYSTDFFAAAFSARFVAIEISHNDGYGDQHAALTPDSFALKWLAKYPTIPAILEFRNVNSTQLQTSISLARAASQRPYSTLS